MNSLRAKKRVIRVVKVVDVLTKKTKLLKTVGQVEKFMKSLDTSKEFKYDLKMGPDEWRLETLEDKEQLEWDMYRLRTICVEYLRK